MTDTLLLVFSAFFLAVVSPGPSNMAVMATAMSRGRRTALTLAAGVTAGSFTWGCLAAAGVTALLATSPHALYAVKIAGGLYMFYLAFRAAKSATQKQGALGAAAPIEKGWRTFVRGYLMHLTNPKAILGWTAIIAVGLPAQPTWQLIGTILLGCFLISATSNSTYAVLFSTAPMVAGYRRCRRVIEGALAGMFAFAGLKLLTSRF